MAATQQRHSCACVQWVRQLLERDNRVLAGVRNPDKASKLKELKAQHKGQLSILSLDVADVDSIGDWAKLIKQKADTVDVCNLSRVALYDAASCVAASFGTLCRRTRSPAVLLDFSYTNHVRAYARRCY